MKVSLKQAVKMFYSQSSFDQIYQEAVANALDAGARNISIFFEANSLTDVGSFKLTISDDPSVFIHIASQFPEVMFFSDIFQFHFVVLSWALYQNAH